ncbi:MAG: hypothetical protein KatS3mg131_0727 [Candidatus Tectimicrobiota bacterium]|nr:MAG: hypothetical protein KatS3mg131_0727 [Candidatus Tectomicrobia bacterium]
MRDFVRVGFRLRRAQREVKLVYTGFLLFVALGLGTNGVMQLWRIGPSLARIAAYFRGGELGEAMAFPKTFGELLELTHFHAFMMGVVFLILAHLCLATGLATPWKAALILLALGGSLGDLAAYWLLRYLSPAWALLQLLAWVAMWLGYGGMLLVALWEMWSGATR